jgi:hypothetical protein
MMMKGRKERRKKERKQARKKGSKEGNKKECRNPKLYKLALRQGL